MKFNNTIQKFFIWELTGECRPPMVGEWFVGGRNMNQPEQARFTFEVNALDILNTRIVEIKEIVHIGDRCEYCGISHDDVPVGPCKSRYFRKVELDSEQTEVENGLQSDC